MKISPIINYQYNYNYKTAQNFKGAPVETLTHYNIGMMKDGIIGKVRVFKNGKEAFLNVDKFSDPYGNETYLLKDKIGNIIGEMDIVIKKTSDYRNFILPNDLSHVFVQFVCNHSNPNTSYYTQGLEEYKNVGTRLLQIAQRRSDEACCNGEIRLSPKFSARDFYKKIGFKEEYIDGKESYKMYLPPEAKAPFSRLYGGL